MSIMIKGMRMPTSCYDCNCFIRDSDGSDYCCLLMLDIEDNDKRDDDCPLVPVPPHGRLIDADVLTNRVGSYMPIKWTYEYGSVVSLNDIEHAPTIIPAEESET